MLFFLIILNFYKVNPNIPHATYLTIGCSLLIYIGINKNDFMYKFINIKFFIFTGLISYSLYLWHWPIISIFKYLKITELNQIDLITCFLSTYVLAIFSWKYIEQPFLQSKNIYTLIKFVGLSYLFLIFLCILILFNKNFPSPYEKFPNSIAEANGSTYHCNLFEYRKFGDTYACELNTKKNNLEFVLFGNSHAHMYGWPIKKLLKEYDKNGLTIPLNNCLPTINKNISLSCLIKANNYFNSISANKEIKTVIIGLTWHTLNLIDKNGQKFNKVEDRNDSLLHLVNQFKLLDKKSF